MPTTDARNALQVALQRAVDAPSVRTELGPPSNFAVSSLVVAGVKNMVPNCPPTIDARHPALLWLLAPLAAALLLALPSPASAAAPRKCTRGGAVLLARSGDVVVVGVRRKPRGQETRRDEYLGCLASTGRRFRLFVSRDFGDDLREHDRFAFLEGRFLGVVREFEGGVSLSQTATTYDVVKRKAARTSRRCNTVDDGDFSGPLEVAFFGRGGIAYSCRRLWVTDAKGERQLEPDGTDVRQLAVSDGPFATRLYWTVYAGETATVKSVELR